jgi:hypothetical protein
VSIDHSLQFRCLVVAGEAPYRAGTVNRILVLSLSGIGDTLMATPLLHELRLQYPSAALDVLVLWAGAAEVLRGNPHVREVIRHDFFEGEPILFSGPLRRIAPPPL